MLILNQHSVPKRQRAAASLVLLAALGLLVALPLLDHHAVEYNPFHAHLVLGAGSEADLTAALSNHHHTYEHPHRHDPVTGLPISDVPATSNPGPRVLAIAADVSSLVAYSWAADLGLVSAAVLLALPSVGLWRRLGAQRPIASPASLLILTPPPRAC